MRYQIYMFFILVVQSVVIYQVENTTCPYEGHAAVRQISVCLSGFNRITGFTNETVNGSAIEEYCTTKVEAEVKCVERIHTDCRANPTTRRVLDKLVNYDGIRNAVKITCDNTDKIKAKQDCLADHQEDVFSCLFDEYNKYIQKVSQLRLRAVLLGRKWLEDQIYKALCLYTEKVTECHEPYGRYCGKDIGDIFDAMTESQTPPVCSTGNSPSPRPATIPGANAPNASPHRATCGVSLLGFLVLVGFFVNGLW